MEVSVVIPNFNGIAFLDSVLASLEGQTLVSYTHLDVYKRQKNYWVTVCEVMSEQLERVCTMKMIRSSMPVL